MRDDTFANWYGLTGALARNSGPIPNDEFEGVLKLYEACFKAFAVDRDESGVHVTSPAVGEQERAEVHELEVSFADYRLTSSIDTFVASVSLDRAREEPNPRQMGELVRTQIKACVRDTGEFIRELHIPKELWNSKGSIDIEAIHSDLVVQQENRTEIERERSRQAGQTTQDALPTPKPKRAPARGSRATSTGVTERPDAAPKTPAGPDETDALDVKVVQRRALFAIDRAIIQSAILVKAAEKLQELPPPPPPLPPDAILDADAQEQREADVELRRRRLALGQRFNDEAKVYNAILDWVRKAAGKLDKLRDALRDERLRKEVENKLVAVATDVDRATPISSALKRGMSYVPRAILAVGAFLVFVNVVWPFFGYPAWLPIVATVAASLLGFFLARGTLSRESVLVQQEKLRSWLEDVLRLNDSKPADILGVLSTRLYIGSPPPPPVATAAANTRRWGQAKAAPQMATAPATFEFSAFGTVQPSYETEVGARRVVPLTALILCVIAGVLPTLTTTLVARLPEITVVETFKPRAVQVIRRVSSREVCEVVSGRLVWQDDRVVYIVEASQNIVSVERSDATEIRYGEARLSMAACASQIAVAPLPDQSLAITNVPVVVEVGAGGDNAQTTLAFESNLYFDGAEIVVTPPDTVGPRYVILTLSNDPVEGFKYADLSRSDYMQGIYNFYRTGKGKTNVEGAVAPIKAALEAAVRSGCVVEIDVQGYASSKEFIPGEPDSNYVLAEGRRSAVLAELGFSPGKYEVVGAGRLRLGQDAPQKPQKDLDIASVLEWNPRFSSLAAMEAVRNQWHSEPNAQTALEESLARSVVIAINDEDLKCPRKPS